MAYIGKIDIEGSYAGWNEEAFSTSVFDKDGYYIQLWQFGPIINQEYLDCLIADENFKTPGADYQAREECSNKVAYVRESIEKSTNK